MNTNNVIVVPDRWRKKVSQAISHPALRVLSVGARHDQELSIHAAHSGSAALAAVTTRFMRDIEKLPTARRLIGARGIETIKHEAAKLKPEMVRSGEDFLTIYSTITKALDEMRGSSYLNEPLKVRKIPEVMRGQFLREWVQLLPVWFHDRIRERNHADHAGLSFTVLINCIKLTISTLLGRSTDDASRKHVLNGDPLEPTLWGMFNAACNEVEILEGDQISEPISTVLLTWLCVVEVEIYNTLYGHAKELEVIYG